MDPTFIQTIKNTFGDEGEAWLSALPDLMAEVSRRWGLSEIQPVPHLSYNFVAFANQTMNREVAKDAKKSFKESSRPSFLRGENSVVLKLGVPNRELTGEISALRFYNGMGACRLLDADAEKCMLLLERLQPGRMLSTIKNDEHATRIAVQGMRQLWHPAPSIQDDFIQLRDWFEGLNNYTMAVTGPLPEKLIELIATQSSTRKAAL